MPIVFPNCKINLGLNIVSKREDGFHELNTVFYPVPFKDALEVSASNNGFSFFQSGIQIREGGKNLCVKAYELLKQDFPLHQDIHLHLLKGIPVGAGLGGGSADAAFTLRLLNNYYHLGLSQEALIDYAATLGSDCAFFIHNKPSFATGRGEILEPIDLTLSGYTIVLIYPGIEISTREAFSKITPALPAHPLKEVIKLAPELWKETLVNDFESSVFVSYPELSNIKQQLYNLGAI